MTEDPQREIEAAERELADMEERSERVAEHIAEARKEWEEKVADSAVPGAAGDPERAEEGGDRPETAYPAKGSDEKASEPEGGDGELPPPDPTETD
jgi:hypothetical protein